MESWLFAKLERARDDVLAKLEENAERCPKEGTERAYALAAFELCKNGLDKFVGEVPTLDEGNIPRAPSEEQLRILTNINVSLRKQVKDQNSIALRVYRTVVGKIGESTRTLNNIHSLLDEEVAKMREELFMMQHSAKDTEFESSELSLDDFLRLAEFKLSHAASALFKGGGGKGDGDGDGGMSAIDMDFRIQQATREMQGQIARLERMLEAEKAATSNVARSARTEREDLIQEQEAEMTKQRKKYELELAAAKESFDVDLKELTQDFEIRMHELQKAFFEQMANQKDSNAEGRRQLLMKMRTVMSSERSKTDAALEAKRNVPADVQVAEEVHTPWEGESNETLVRLLQGKRAEIEMMKSSFTIQTKVRTLEWETALKQIIQKYEAALSQGKSDVDAEKLRAENILKQLEGKNREIASLKLELTNLREEMNNRLAELEFEKGAMERDMQETIDNLEVAMEEMREQLSKHAAEMEEEKLRFEETTHDLTTTLNHWRQLAERPKSDQHKEVQTEGGYSGNEDSHRGAREWLASTTGIGSPMSSRALNRIGSMVSPHKKPPRGRSDSPSRGTSRPRGKKSGRKGRGRGSKRGGGEYSASDITSVTSGGRDLNDFDDFDDEEEESESAHFSSESHEASIASGGVRSRQSSLKPGAVSAPGRAANNSGDGRGLEEVKDSNDTVAFRSRHGSRDGDDGVVVDSEGDDERRTTERSKRPHGTRGTPKGKKTSGRSAGHATRRQDGSPSRHANASPGRLGEDRPSPRGSSRRPSGSGDASRRGGDQELPPIQRRRPSGSVGAPSGRDPQELDRDEVSASPPAEGVEQGRRRRRRRNPDAEADGELYSDGHSPRRYASGDGSPFGSDEESDWDEAELRVRGRNVYPVGDPIPREISQSPGPQYVADSVVEEAMRGVKDKDVANAAAEAALFDAKALEDLLPRLLQPEKFFEAVTRMAVLVEYSMASPNQHTMSPTLKRLKRLIPPRFAESASRLDPTPIDVLDMTNATHFMVERVFQPWVAVVDTLTPAELRLFKDLGSRIAGMDRTMRTCRFPQRWQQVPLPDVRDYLEGTHETQRAQTFDVKLIVDAAMEALDIHHELQRAFDVSEQLRLKEQQATKNKPLLVLSSMKLEATPPKQSSPRAVEHLTHAAKVTRESGRSHVRSLRSNQQRWNSAMGLGSPSSAESTASPVALTPTKPQDTLAIESSRAPQSARQLRDKKKPQL